MNKILSFSVIVIVLIGGIVLYRSLLEPTAAVIAPEVSDLSQDRIATMKAEGSLSASLRLTANQAGETITTSCFKVSIPLPYSSTRTTEEDNKCLLRAQLTKPRGVYVVHTELRPGLTSLQELTGVKLRTESKEYQNVQLRQSSETVAAYQSATELSVFLYQQPVVVAISFSELPIVSEDVISAAESAIDQLQVFPVE